MPVTTITLIHLALLLGSLAATGDARRIESQTPDTEIVIKDIDGRESAPFRLDDAKASVILFITQDCPISNRYAPEIGRITTEYQPRGVRFQLAYVDPTVGIIEIRKHRQEYGLSQLTAVHDTRHLLVKAAGATVTPEAAVIGAGGRLLYRGRIDNQYAAFGRPRRQVTEHDLRDALDAILAGKPVTVARTSAIGCYISPAN